MYRRSLAPLALMLVALLAVAALGSSAAAAGKQPGLAKRGIVVRALASGGWKALPVRGAKVRVLHRGEVIARGRVGSEGMALLRTRGKRPAGFRVVVSGGRIGKHRFRGRISATVRHYSWPRTVHTDFVTTLADRYRRAHPATSARQAERRTKRFLALAPSYVIGVDGSGDIPFDGRRFLAAAGTGRHYGPFVAKLVGRMDAPGARRSFRHKHRGGAKGSARASVGLPGAGELAKVAEQIASGKGLFEALENGTALGGLAKTILGLAGGGKEKEPKLQAEMKKMLADLQQIEQSLSVVQETVNELREESREFDYESKVGEVRGFQRTGAYGEEALHSAAALGVQENCGTASPGPKCEQIAGLLTGPSGFVATVFEKGLGSAAGLTEYAEAIGGNAIKGSAPDYRGIVQAGSALITDGGRQAFFSAGESTRLRALAAYWIASYAETATVAAGAWALHGDNELTVQTNVEEATKFATGISSLVPEAVPQRAVVDMRTGQMWPTTNSASASTWIAQRVLERPWRFDVGSGEWVSEPASGEEKTEPETLPLLGGKGGKLPFSDWRIPKAAQVNQLLQSVTPKPGQFAGEAVLEQAGIEQGVFVTPWGEGDEKSLGIYTGHTNAASGDAGRICSAGNSNSSCYWPVMVGTGSYWQQVWVTNARQVGEVYSYSDGIYEASYDEAALGAFGEILYGELKTEMVWNEGKRYGGVPVLFYRDVPQSACYYYPAPGNPSPGSPGCPGT